MNARNPYTGERITLRTRETFPRLVLSYIAREVPRENDLERARRQARETDRIPPLTHISARDDLRMEGIR
jgi:hypothetical protein